MKNLLKLLGIILAACIVIFVIHLIVMALIHKGTPHTWELKGHFVVDENYYGGKYYHINDSLRVIAHYNNVKHDKYYVYLLENDKWIKTSAWTYKSTHDSNYGMLQYLRIEYNNYLDDRKYTEEELIWEY